MAPRPEEGSDRDTVKVGRPLTDHAGYRLSHPSAGEEVVVSGISGSFPDSHGVYEFGENLFNKVDLVTDDTRRWDLVHPEIPKRCGKVFDVNRFDAEFFGVNYNQAHCMDPQARILLERTYEAIIDAGVNPMSLKGSNTGVFIGTCYSETEKTWIYENAPIHGLGLSGCTRGLLANRISYWLDIKGPSYAMDSACSSSFYLLEMAYKAIRDGQCDSAIIGATNLCLHPYLTLQFSRLGVLSNEGVTRSFDENAKGYARAEAVAIVFLQRAKDARRCYTQVVHGKSNSDGFKPEGISHPSGTMQRKLIEEIYSEAEVPPSSIEYLEAHATGTRAGDPEEANALDDIFCAGRNGPLKIGSVKSNMGHSEPTAGFAALAKVIVAYNTGYIPPTLHYKSPREGVEGLRAGRLEVVVEKTPWNRGLVGINCFGFGGANSHALFKNIAKPKINNGSPKDNLTRLVCVSGRTESAVKRILDDLISRPNVDTEQIALLYEIHKQEIPRHRFRGYSLLKPNGIYKDAIREITKCYFSSKKPIVFAFGGIGSQWPGMGRDLMQISTFANAIDKCHKVLKPEGVDINGILSNDSPKNLENILNTFVGITAVQIGTCDVLKSIGIEPDFIIGHSFGELGCAYADGCMSIEETILTSYYSALAIIESSPEKGLMAEIGMGCETLKTCCPEDIDISSYNNCDSSIISGPAESTKAFVNRLQSRGIRAQKLASSNIALHSKYISKAGPKILKYLKKLLSKPVKRTERWYSTSNPENSYQDSEGMYTPAEYHTNTLLKPVHFEDASRVIPKDAIVIEIGPSDSLQPILRKCLHKKCLHVSMTKQGEFDQFEFMLTSIGKLFHNGVNPNLAALYPEVKFPVSCGTPMLAHLVEWDHSEDWFVTSYENQEQVLSGERIVKVDFADEDNYYMSGHVVDGRNLYPATGYLFLVWETLALMRGELYTEVSVTFENVKFIRATNIPKEGSLDFIVMIQKGSGHFEITESGATIVSGTVYAEKSPSDKYKTLSSIQKPSGGFVGTMDTKDIYKELRLRGYNYNGEFRAILEADIDGSKGKLLWNNNWITFMDTMMQMLVLSIDTRGLFVPTSMRKFSIDTTKHFSDLSIFSEDEQQHLPVYINTEIEVIRSGGVEILGLQASHITKRIPAGIPVLEKYEFIPFFPKHSMQTKDVIKASIQLILENVQGYAVKSVEIIDSATSPNNEPLTPLILEALEDLPLIQPDVSIFSNEKLNLGSNILVEAKSLTADLNALLVVGTNLLNRNDILQQAVASLSNKGYIISRENLNTEPNALHKTLDLISVTNTDTEKLVLLKKQASAKPSKFLHIKSEDDKFSWIEPLKEMLNESQKVVLISEGEELNGIIGLANCLRREPGGDIVSCVAIMDKDAPKFNKVLPLFKEQLEKQLGINVYKNGQWGSYRHLTIDPLQTIKADHAYLNTLTTGDLSSFRWFQGGLRFNKAKYIVNINYASLVFKDTLMASGRITMESYTKDRLCHDCMIGTEFSGKTKSGIRVAGICVNYGLANTIAADPSILWPIPDEWTLEEGATIPNAYSTVLYAFFMRNKLKRGSRVLVHAGAGGVGQAAIHVCLFYDCEVFTTVGSQVKRDFIKKMFPEIKESHIGNSRDNSFEDMVMKETNGGGVDYVLNSLSEEKLLTSVRCLGPRGKFLEIGKFDIINNNELGLHLFNKEQSFQGIMMDMITLYAVNDKYKIQKLVFDHIKNGCIKPLCRTIFETSEVEKAFRFMSAGKHIGKVLIRISPEEDSRPSKTEPLCMDALPRYHCYPEYSYIVVGGLGGFGLELADWLVLRGARKLVLNSRRGITNGYQTFRIKTWASYGVQVVVSKDDVSTREGCRKLLQDAEKMGPVSAIFNLAVILKDAIFENQTPETFKTSLGPKAVATKFLDSESRKLCPQLKNFVIFSSVSCGRGNAGQTNYGMANSIMERICEQRQKAGYPGLAIQWGAVGEVGLVAEMQEEQVDVEIGGTLQQRISSCLKVMDTFLSQSSPIVSSMVVAEKKVGVCKEGDVLGTVGSIIGVKDLKTISHQIALSELGMDSIMAVEIRQVLEREFGIITTAQEIRSITFARLLQLAEKSTSGDDTSVQTSDARLDIFIKNLGEEVESTESILNFTPLKISNGSQINNNLSKAGQQIFMVPGIEGMALVFDTLTKKLNRESSVLQMGYEFPDQDYRSIATRLLKHIRPSLEPKSSFTLLGYSFGTAVVLEIARILESEGHIGDIILIDGSPDFLQAYMKVNLHSLEPTVMQNNLLGLLYDTFVPNNTANILQALKEFPTWDEKLNIFVKNMPSGLKYSEKFLKRLANSIAMRNKSIAEHNLWVNTKKLKSNGVLIRTKNLSAGVTIEESYCLNNYFEKTVKVHMVDSDHSSIVESEDCINIINKIISD